MTASRIEGPADLERLWEEAEPLEAGDLPTWLSVEDAHFYRRVAALSAVELSHEERDRIEAAGLVVDGSGVYIADPTGEPVFAIGIYEGRSPLTLLPAAVAANPVLTREQVSDVSATYVADPFLLRAGGVWHMFLEVYNWRANKGEIGHATSEDGFRWTYGGVVLGEPFHVSYPCVLEWRGSRYIVPETHQANAVRLYRAEDFPYRWTPVAELLSGEPFLDASPFRHGARWWLFVCVGADDTLRLYGASELLGPWVEHPQSPIVEGDAAKARPAGRVLAAGRLVVRFAQDCSRAYGAAVRAFAVTTLTEREYEEHEVLDHPLLTGVGGGGWNGGGMHHVDARRVGQGRWVAAVDGWRKG